MRAFIAVDLPVPELAQSSPLGSRAPSHLTLRFLGDITVEDVERVRTAMEKAVEGFPAFDIRLKGVGAFPSPRRPRVVWIGIQQGSEELVSLERRLSDQLAKVNFPPEARPFVPHLTLLRVRDRVTAQMAQQRLAADAEREFGTVHVDAIDLKQSVLSSSGAIHTVVARASLRENPRSHPPTN